MITIGASTRKVGFPRICSALAPLLACLFASAPVISNAATIHVTGYEVLNFVTAAAGVPGYWGDLSFSSDGNTAYFIGESESSGAGVWEAAVIRDGNGNVTGFGAAANIFLEDYIDTGLLHYPGSTTQFYRGYDGDDGDDYGIGQRTAGGAIEYKVINNYDAEYGGLAVVPDLYPNAGNLLSSSYGDGQIFLHSVSDDGDGTYTIGDGTLFADYGVTSSVGDMEYVTSGPLANTLIFTNWDDGGNQTVHYYSIDPATGLPVGGTTATPQLFVSGYDDAWGLSIDPVTDNIWLINYNDDPLLQITATATAVPEPSSIAMFGIGALGLFGYSRRRRQTSAAA